MAVSRANGFFKPTEAAPDELLHGVVVPADRFSHQPLELAHEAKGIQRHRMVVPVEPAFIATEVDFGSLTALSGKRQLASVAGMIGDADQDGSAAIGVPVDQQTFSLFGQLMEHRRSGLPQAAALAPDVPPRRRKLLRPEQAGRMELVGYPDPLLQLAPSLRDRPGLPYGDKLKGFDRPGLGRQAGFSGFDGQSTCRAHAH